MAEEDKTIVEGRDGEEGKQEGSGKKKKGFSKLILFGGIGVGAIVIGIALTIFVIKPMTSGSDAGEQQQTEEVIDGSHAEEEDSHDNGSSHGEEGGGSSNIYTIKDIVINPAGTGGSRFLSISFAFELNSSSQLKKFELREPAIRDALITILSSKTVVQLTDPKQKEIARYQIKKRVEKLLKLKEIAGVYYTDFVLQ